MAVKNVRFHHYVLTLIFPPLTYFLVGRPVSGIANMLVWSPIVYGLCFVFGIGFIFWAMAVFGPANHANIGAWQRLRSWERGFEVID